MFIEVKIIISKIGKVLMNPQMRDCALLVSFYFNIMSDLQKICKNISKTPMSPLSQFTNYLLFALIIL